MKIFLIDYLLSGIGKKGEQTLRHSLRKMRADDAAGAQRKLVDYWCSKGRNIIVSKIYEYDRGTRSFR